MFRGGTVVDHEQGTVEVDVLVAVASFELVEESKLAALGVAVSVDGYGEDEASEKAGGPAHTASAHSGNTRVE